MKIFITGGCGFIGRNAAQRFLELGHSVTAFDDLSRPGSDLNLDAMSPLKGFTFEGGDIRDASRVADLVKRGKFDVVLHLAAQVAVTTSMIEPQRDFDINARGTVNVLEAVRLHNPGTILLNASTNKVYGDLHEVGYGEESSRYTLPSLPLGVSEKQALDFHSPYGCSKGTGDQYVIDYARCYGLRTVTFRQSCIYGYWQYGIEDQGWVAWFIIAHLLGHPITVFGTGKQVRDVLFIDDLVNCYVAAIERIDAVSGLAFNIGGGPENTMSLIEFLQILETISGKRVDFAHGASRPGDQPVFVSDIARARKLLGWAPTVQKSEGIKRLYEWVASNRALFRPMENAAAAS
jgi:CDP-paratose 2-epimerase